MLRMKYKIVPDNDLGWEVRIWRWWWPFWVQADGSNTHRTYIHAETWFKNMYFAKVTYL